MKTTIPDHCLTDPAVQREKPDEWQVDVDGTIQNLFDERDKLKSEKAELLEALQNLFETLEWLAKSGNLKSPIEPHPFGLGVIQAKQQARALIAKHSGQP